jgi:rhodanese-related sulfurtransferase
MSTIFSRMTLNQKLGSAVVVLGLGALAIGTPFGGTAFTVDARELGRIVQTEVDHVAPEELADWIVQGKTDFRLIDLRSEKEFAEYHIPRAENVQISGLADYGLLRNEKIVLYSEGGIHSAQAWFLLKAGEYRGVYMLRGGLEEWKDKVLFPRIPPSPTADQTASFEKMKEVSKFFGGTPLSGAPPDQPAAAQTIPKLEMPSMPATPAAAGAGAPTKKKKEGC